jgi:predicted metal-dependent peptidase
MSDQKDLTRGQLQELYTEAIDYLDTNYAYFLTHVLKIGKPEWTTAMDTAAVMLDLKDQAVWLGSGTGKSDDLDYNEFKFVFNPTFASQLPIPILAFVLAHETMHIILNHLKLSRTFVDVKKLRKLQEAREQGRGLKKDEIADMIKQNQNAMRFNIAADCVINDYLANAGFEMWEHCMRGEKVVGTDCSNLTVTEVYQLLLKQANQQPQQCQTCGGTGKKPQDDQKQDGKKDQSDSGQGQDQKDDQDGSGGDQDQDSDGQDKNDQSGQGAQGGQDQSGGHQHGQQGEPCPDCGGSGQQPGGGVGADYQQMDDHNWMLDPNFADQLADAIDKLNDEMENKHDDLPTDLQDKKDEEEGKATQYQNDMNDSMRAGTEKGNMADFIEQHGSSIAWAKLLKECDPNIFKEPGVAPPLLPSFQARPRKLGAFPKTVLPVYRREHRIARETNEKPAIVLALDVSGSIGPRDSQRFISLAKSIPFERIHLFCCTFNTRYRQIDPQSDKRVEIGGGTDFDAIADFIDSVVKPELKGCYPKAVVVITDGEAPMSRMPSEKEGEGWLWLISPADRSGSYYPASNSIGRKAKLNEYIA